MQDNVLLLKLRFNLDRAEQEQTSPLIAHFTRNKTQLASFEDLCKFYLKE